MRNPEKIGQTVDPPRRKIVPGPRTIAILLLVLILLGAGCFGKRRRKPDLGEIYNRAAQYHKGARNPIIVVPGMMGSKLVDDETGTRVWGAFSGGYAKPGTPEGARLVALPMEQGRPLSELTDSVRADGVLGRVRMRFIGIPLRILPYFHILGALGAGGYRDEELGLSGAIDYGVDHFTCFQFPYDWRRDISESAIALGAFIRGKREYVRRERERRFGIDQPEIRFDVVAHSMGSLVVRYYLRYGTQPLPEDGSLPELTWAGAREIERVVLVGPPNAGSLGALRDLIEGHKPGPTLPRYAPAIVGSMPASYQLLPRGRHHCIVEQREDEKPRSLDPYDPAVWEAMGWGLANRSPEQDRVLARLMPELPDVQSRRTAALDHLHKSLKRARQLAESLDRPARLPEGLSLYLIAGDAIQTPEVASVDPDSGELRIVGRTPGDGTVTRASALMDERLSGDWSTRLRSPIDWTHGTFLFREHLEMTKDPEFTDNVLFILLELR